METNATHAVHLARLERRIGPRLARKSARKNNCFRLYLLARMLHRADERPALRAWVPKTDAFTPFRFLITGYPDADFRMHASFGWQDNIASLDATPSVPAGSTCGINDLIFPRCIYR